VPNVSATCKQPSLGACVCRHAEQKSAKTDIDEQEDIVHQFMEADLRSGWSKENMQQAVQHVENMPVPQGGVYTGQALPDGQPHGVGTQHWADGTTYSGNWINGAAHGDGKLAKADGSGYEGHWVEGRKHGFGKEKLVDESE
jgi:hypothetical protein